MIAAECLHAFAMHHAQQTGTFPRVYGMAMKPPIYIEMRDPILNQLGGHALEKLREIPVLVREDVVGDVVFFTSPETWQRALTGDFSK